MLPGRGANWFKVFRLEAGSSQGAGSVKLERSPEGVVVLSFSSDLQADTVSSSQLDDLHHHDRASCRSRGLHQLLTSPRGGGGPAQPHRAALTALHEDHLSVDEVRSGLGAAAVDGVVLQEEGTGVAAQMVLPRSTVHRCRRKQT